MSFLYCWKSFVVLKQHALLGYIHVVSYTVNEKLFHGLLDIFHVCGWHRLKKCIIMPIHCQTSQWPVIWRILMVATGPLSFRHGWTLIQYSSYIMDKG